MITPISPADGHQITHYGLSTDVKPLNANNADIFYEMDTKTVFLFDAENKVWLKQ